VNGSSPGAGDACAVRVPCGVVCAPATAAISEKAAAKAPVIATVPIRIFTPAQSCFPQAYGLRLPGQRQLRDRAIFAGTGIQGGGLPRWKEFFAKAGSLLRIML
jgi:hypothetical protein